MATKPKSASQTGVVRTSGVNPALAAQAAITQHFRFVNSLPTISNQFADGVAVIDFPVGKYVYRNFCLSIGNSAAIAGETIFEGGGYRVDSGNLSKYVESVEIEIDGKVEVSYTAGEIIDYNQLMGWDIKDGFHFLCFGAPGFFDDYPQAEDAYYLATGNIRSLRLLVKLKTAWLATMKLKAAAEYAPVLKPLQYIVTMRQQRYVVPGTGEYTISDIPHGVDLSAIWVRGMNAKRIDGVTLKVDDQIIFDVDTPEFAALGQLWGKSHAQLAAGNLFIDFWREGNPNKGLAALTAAAEVRRNADIRLTLTMGEANAELKIVTLHCGPWSLQK